MGMTERFTRQRPAQMTGMIHVRSRHSSQTMAQNRYIQPIWPRIPHQRLWNRPPSVDRKQRARATRRIMPRSLSHRAGFQSLGYWFQVRKKPTIIRRTQRPRFPVISRDSWLQMKAPITSRANVRLKMCLSVLSVEYPFSLLRSSA